MYFKKHKFKRMKEIYTKQYELCTATVWMSPPGHWNFTITVWACDYLEVRGRVQHHELETVDMIANNMDTLRKQLHEQLGV